MSNLFQKLEIEAFKAGINPRTEESRQWFRRRLQSLRRVNRRELLQSDEINLVNKSQPLIGSMNMFFYDPKTKDTLPYYDRFPLAIIVGPAPGGFYGLNLHYLPPIMRAKMLDALMDVASDNKYDESTRFKLSYQILQRVSRLKYYKPCLKHYLFSHVKSRLGRVSAPEWEIATFLPTQDFAKKGANAVYADSRKMI